jgi:hypothetical protein
MRFNSCSSEKEVAELIARGQWPQASTPELRAHASACRACGELILVTSAFQRARTQAASAAKLSSPGALWWRAQLRRRNAAVERVGKPILGAQIFALAIYLFAAVAFIVSQARHGLNWLSWAAQLPQLSSLHLEALWPAGLFNPGWGLLVLLIPALATLALLGGVVVYLASEKQ